MHWITTRDQFFILFNHVAKPSLLIFLFVCDVVVFHLIVDIDMPDRLSHDVIQFSNDYISDEIFDHWFNWVTISNIYEINHLCHHRGETFHEWNQKWIYERLALEFFTIANRVLHHRKRNSHLFDDQQVEQNGANELWDVQENVAINRRDFKIWVRINQVN